MLFKTLICSSIWLFTATSGNRRTSNNVFYMTNVNRFAHPNEPPLTFNAVVKTQTQAEKTLLDKKEPLLKK